MSLRTIAASTAFSLLLITQAFSNDIRPYQERFKVIKKDGKAIMIKDKSLSFNFSINPYIKFIKEKLLSEQELMNSKADYEYEVAALFEAEMLEKGELNNRNVGLVVDSLKELKKIDVDKVFNDSGFKQVINKFESKIGDALKSLDPSIVANLENSKFYYKKRVTYQVLTWGLNFAKKRLSSIPILNTASYVLVQVERLIRERRTFHQNMLLHYFENFSEDELGMTHDEVNKAFSSVYESRIPWFAIWESNAAQQNWLKYGTNKFFQSIRTANTRLRAQSGRYSELGKRINYAFQEAVEKDQKVILNLFDSQNMINRKPAVAFYMDSPKKVARLRTVLQLAQLGLSFIPLPNFVKSLGERYMKSFYEAQKLTEGALYGYFESNNEEEGMEDIKAQYLNPFDKLD